MARKKSQQQEEVTPRDLGDLSEDHLLCRDIRHPWESYDVKVDRRNRQITRILRCARCQCLRYEYMDMNGLMTKSPSYSYPEGYQLKGHGYVTARDRARVRVMNILGGNQ